MLSKTLKKIVSPVTCDWLAAGVPAFASLHGFRQALRSGLLNGARAVRYDLGAASPLSEQKEPRRAVSNFCSLALESGLRCYVSPSFELSLYSLLFDPAASPVENFVRLHFPAAMAAPGCTKPTGLIFLVPEHSIALAEKAIRQAKAANPEIESYLEKY